MVKYRARTGFFDYGEEMRTLGTPTGTHASPFLPERALTRFDMRGSVALRGSLAETTNLSFKHNNQGFGP
jgi:hypothetical protein